MTDDHFPIIIPNSDIIWISKITGNAPGHIFSAIEYNNGITSYYTNGKFVRHGAPPELTKRELTPNAQMNSTDTL